MDFPDEITNDTEAFGVVLNLLSILKTQVDDLNQRVELLERSN